MTKNKVALVTGSSKRVGQQLIIDLSAAGYEVWIHYNTSQSEAHTLRDNIRENGSIAHCVSGDIRKKEDVQQYDPKHSKYQWTFGCFDQQYR